MRKLEMLFASFILAAADLFLFVRAIENVGGNVCDTKDDQVFVTELTKSVDATVFGFQDRIAAGQERFMIGSTKNGIRRALLKFMVGSEEDIFPFDVKVECTEIRLFLARSDEERRTVPVPRINLHRVASKWTTTGKNNLQLRGLNGGIASTGDTTWKYASYPTSEWENQGGDFYRNVLATNIQSGDLHWYGKTRAMTEVVQEWIEDASTNHGFILIGSDENDELSPPGSYSRYNGIESSPELIPRLIVTYTSPSQGKPHRTYNDYIRVIPDDNGDDDDGVIGLMIGGVVVSVITSAIVVVAWLRSRTQLEFDGTNGAEYR